MIENTPKFWRSVTVGSSVTLSDSLTLVQSQASGDGLASQVYSVNRIFSVILPESNIRELQWLFIELDGGNSEFHMWLMVKIADDRHISIRVYSELNNVRGDRQDCISNNAWLFDEVDGTFIEDMNDEDREALNLLTLQYVAAFNLDGQYEYIRKDQGEITATLSGGICSEDQLVTLVEYICENEECEEPEAVLLEMGHRGNSSGGAIRLMVGTEIRPTEVDII